MKKKLLKQRIEMLEAEIRLHEKRIGDLENAHCQYHKPYSAQPFGCTGDPLHEPYYPSATNELTMPPNPEYY